MSPHMTHMTVSDCKMSLVRSHTFSRQHAINDAKVIATKHERCTNNGAFGGSPLNLASKYLDHALTGWGACR